MPLKSNHVFQNLVKMITKKEVNKIALGRWSNENHIKTNIKVDYANEDHCGVCTNLLQSESTKKYKNKEKN